ncbi:LacI family DNA-binding transcriptional regulator [Kineococcus sp. GCM10028916]|uniref:LacI family DNA-binding transcriptional regulator n=1 Tax=unclassified Kineococcus TaxID=2621656 RepID=UPI002E248D21
MTQEISPVRKRATIYEVAALAGVSHQTVSRYLRNNGGLKPTTTEKVAAAIQELNYRPNLIARSMRTRRTGRVAFLLPTTTATPALPLRLISEAVGVAHGAGYTIDLIGREGSAGEQSERVQEIADSGEFEGILALGTGTQAPTPTSATPVVTMSTYDAELRGTGALADGTACGEIVRMLVGLGHRHFLHVSGPLTYTSARNRRQTFLDVTAELGVEATVFLGDWQGESGYEAIATLPRDSPVTAVVAGNDYSAMGAIRAATQRGWRVHRDLSVFGWDDNGLGRFCTPTLSTVANDLERQGREAMERLIALMRHEEPPAADPRSLHRVLPRESVGVAPTRRPRLRAVPRS